jgi:hypothetical protein
MIQFIFCSEGTQEFILCCKKISERLSILDDDIENDKYNAMNKPFISCEDRRKNNWTPIQPNWKPYELELSKEAHLH